MGGPTGLDPGFEDTGLDPVLFSGLGFTAADACLRQEMRQCDSRPRGFDLTLQAVGPLVPGGGGRPGLP